MLLFRDLFTKHDIPARCPPIGEKPCHITYRTGRCGTSGNFLKSFIAAFTVFLSTSAAYGVDNATWAGSLIEPEWGSALNWKDTGSILGGVPTDTATFDGSAWGSSVNIGYGSNINIKTIHFTADAKEYSFHIGGILIPAHMTITGKGIVNDGAPAPKFHVGGVLLGKGTLCFTNEATAGNAALSSNSKGKICFADKAKAGEATITMAEDSKLEFSGESSADKSKIDMAKGSEAVFKDRATAGESNIKISDKAHLSFEDKSKGGSSTIDVSSGGSVDFKGNSSAEDAKINVAEGGKTNFDGNSTGGNAKITVDKGGNVNFSGNSTGGNAVIDVKDGGKAAFDDKSNAGSSKITAEDNGSIDFNKKSSAKDSNIDVKKDGTTGFHDNSSAGKSKITSVDGGEVDFKDGSTADNSSIEVKNGGKAKFDDKASAGNSKIIAIDNGSVDFDGNSTSDNSSIKVGKDGKANFNENSTAGESQIEIGPNGSVNFKDNATGGKADVKIDKGGAMDMSGLTNGGMDISSIKGDGTINLGGNNLSVGGDNKDSDFGGKITGSGGLEKIGGGGLVLSGDNDFSGGVAVKEGNVDARSNKALGTGDVTISNGSNVNLGASGDYPNRIKIGEGDSGSISASKGVEANPKGIIVGDGGRLDIGKPGSKEGGGNITLNGADSDFGKNTNISVNNGGLKLGDDKAGKLFDKEGSTLNINKDGSIDLNGHDLNVNNLTGKGSISSSKAGDAAINIKSGDFGGKISDGAGKVGVNKTGDGTLRLTGDNDYSGKTQVNGGELKLEGNLKNSDVVVGKGAKISGSGTVHGLHAQDGSSVSPGISDKKGGTGKLVVEGDSIFEKGSNLVIKQGKGGTTDQVVIKGDANIKGGNVATKGLLHPGDNFKDVISSTGNLTGGFDGIQPEFETDFIKPVFEKTASGISIKIVRNGVTLDDVGRSGNEAKLGRGMESLPLTNRLMIQVLNSTKAEAQEALKRLSGQVYASTRTAILQGGNYLPSFMNERMDEYANGSRAAGNAAGGKTGSMTKMLGYPAFGGLDMTATGSVNSKNSLAGLLPMGNHAIGNGGAAVWARAFSSAQNNTKSSNGAYGHEMNTTGTFVGLDTLAGQWLLGGALGYSYSDFTNKELINYGHMQSLYSGIYGGRQYKGVNIRLGAQQNWYEIHTKRSVEFVRYSDFLKSKYHARLTQIFGQAGLPFDFAKSRLEPFAGLSYNYLYNDKMREHGGDAALSGAKGSHDYVASILGVRGRMQLQNTGERTAIIHAMLGWQHAYGSTVPATNLSFAESQAFDTQGTPLERDNMALETGLDFHFTNKTMFGISYSGQYGQKNTDHGIRVNFRTRY